MKPTRFIDSVNCAIEGILHATRTQKHMRYHFLAALAVLFTTLLLRVSSMEFMLLALAVSFVLFAELMNTAVEIVVDMISPGYHPLAKLAKDVAAGAVLVAAFGTAIMGYLVLARYVLPWQKAGLEMIGTESETGMVVSVVLVLIVVVIMKARGGTGTPLEGGGVSGHSAVGFCIATSVALHTQDPLIAVFCFILAAMVSHSRLLLRIHRPREVVAGGLVGVAITVAVHLLFRAFG
ncbi:phosphatase PAP2 family protein [Geomonas terrae]|uniref:Phosphatase PAP2 family protein n=1 Tax=Geomonas terrae TaxID=2562681 RepID=A0A4S1C9I9_9BACT|nr:diacylglycerol kinase [Geomonas terrae]TGU69941.1 phosphatase PAP2 family protein [Geomonas terrae]